MSPLGYIRLMQSETNAPALEYCSAQLPDNANKFKQIDKTYFSHLDAAIARLEAEGSLDEMSVRGPITVEEYNKVKALYGEMGQAMVEMLKSLGPNTACAELYTSLGEKDKDYIYSVVKDAYGNYQQGVWDQNVTKVSAN